MALPNKSIPQERFRVLCFDGGPSSPVMLRIIRHLEQHNPGFLERTDMFAGASDGAFISLYLAHALSQGYKGLEAIEACIDFHDKVLMTLKVTLGAILRMASGWLSMFDGQALSEVLTAYYKTGDQKRDAVLGDLTRHVSIECYDATTRQTVTFTQFKTPHTKLVHAALASSAFSPLFPAFRSNQDDSAYRGNLLLDGGLVAHNSPVLAALADGLQFLWKSNPRSRSAPKSFIDADDDLRKISMISMGCGIQRMELIRPLFSIPWPPFGLQKNKNLYQYGLLWTLAPNVYELLGAMVQRQATDDSLFARQLLGGERFIRFAPDNVGLTTVLTLALDPKQFIEESEERANALWEGVVGAELLSWVQRFWMTKPPLPQEVTVPTPAAVG